MVADGVLSVLTDEKINDLAKQISDLSAKEGNTEIVKRLKTLLRENEEATANLVKAIEKGTAVDLLSAQIDKRQSEKADLEVQLAQEKMIRPVLSYDDVRFFFGRFKRGGNAKDYAYRIALIDVLVDRIYLYEGEDARIEIYCRASDQSIKMPINEPDIFLANGLCQHYIAGWLRRQGGIIIF